MGDAACIMDIERQASPNSHCVALTARHFEVVEFKEAIEQATTSTSLGKY